MKLIIFILFWVPLLYKCIDNSELVEIVVSQKHIISIKFDGNSDVQYKLVEIFSLFKTFNYEYNQRKAKRVNDIYEMLPNKIGVYNFTVIPDSPESQKIWYRVINIRTLKPGNMTVKKEPWSTVISVEGVYGTKNMDLHYYTYALPIFPAGNIISWSSDLKSTFENRENIYFKALNKSIDLQYIQQNGVLLRNSTEKSGTFNYTIASRKTRDFMVILVAYSYGIHVQYPPIFVRGCLVSSPSEKDCLLVDIFYPMYIVMASALIFFCFAFKYDLIHVLFCGWISVGMVAIVIWKVFLYDEKFEGTALLTICVGIAPILAITFTFMCIIISKKYSRIRMFFTSFVISTIFVSVIWFTPLRLLSWNNITLFYTISGVVFIFILIMFYVLNHLTMTLGAVFIIATLVSLSVSINYLKASIIPFIFIDFYNSLVYSTTNWIYYSPLLIDDLIIVVLCPFFSFLIGMFVYSLFKRCISKKDNTVSEITPRSVTFQSIPLTRTIAPTPSPRTHIANAPPSYIVHPQLTNVPLNNPDSLPPTYEACVESTAYPTAPRMSTYKSPYKY